MTPAQIVTLDNTLFYFLAVVLLLAVACAVAYTANSIYRYRPIIGISAYDGKCPQCNEFATLTWSTGCKWYSCAKCKRFEPSHHE